MPTDSRPPRVGTPAARATPARDSTTEACNPRTQGLDRLPTGDLVELLVREDAAAHGAVVRALPELVRATELLRERLEAGGRWLNLGAGTSGRLGVLDAAEIPPTFGLPPDRVQGVIAGGSAALERAVEGAEDAPEAAARDLAERDLAAGDVLVALSASGSTPYVRGGVTHARGIGAATIAITCNPGAPLACEVDLAIVLDVGPEAIAGSTRLKGGLAQKMALHTLSTAVMVRLGRTHGNRMSHLAITNQKLRARALRTLAELTGCSPERAENALDEAGGCLARALEDLARAER